MLGHRLRWSEEGGQTALYKTQNQVLVECNSLGYKIIYFVDAGSSHLIATTRKFPRPALTITPDCSEC